MTQARHTFLVRVLDIESRPTFMKVVKSIEEGIELYDEMTNKHEFLIDEDMFEISQGAIILKQLNIDHDEGDESD